METQLLSQIGRVKVGHAAEEDADQHGPDEAEDGRVDAARLAVSIAPAHDEDQEQQGTYEDADFDGDCLSGPPDLDLDQEVGHGDGHLARGL